MHLRALFVIFGCLFINSCVTTNFCKSPCGVELYGTNRCQEFYTNEERALLAFSDHVEGWDRAFTCGQMNGWAVVIRTKGVDETGTWTADTGNRVMGVCWCAYTTIEIGTDAFVSGGALTHEYAHAIERCADHNHSQWNDNGIFKAIWAEGAGGY